MPLIDYVAKKSWQTYSLIFQWVLDKLNELLYRVSHLETEHARHVVYICDITACSSLPYYTRTCSTKRYQVLLTFHIVILINSEQSYIIHTHKKLYNWCIYDYLITNLWLWIKLSHWYTGNWITMQIKGLRNSKFLFRVEQTPTRWLKLAFWDLHKMSNPLVAHRELNNFQRKKKTDFKRFSVYFALNLSSYITYSGNVKYVTGREWRINMY